MRSRHVTKLARALAVAAVFASGYFCGTLGDHRAEAQLGELGSQVLKQAGGGTVAELGTSIIEMEQHVSGLQKNIDTLKKVKSALGG